MKDNCTVTRVTVNTHGLQLSFAYLFKCLPLVILMALEIEVKAYADDLKGVEETLKKMDAHFVKKVYETDTYFNHPARDFAETDEALRIRVAGGKSYLTYKGRKVDVQSKTREEIEVEIRDADTAALLLTKVGFTPVAVVKKVRVLYELGEFDICLDDVEDVGTFVEVETSGEHREERRDAALALLERLNLKKYERKSYLELKLCV